MHGRAPASNWKKIIVRPVDKKLLAHKGTRLQQCECINMDIEQNAAQSDSH